MEVWKFGGLDAYFHEDTKERKGLGTSPFGSPSLTWNLLSLEEGAAQTQQETRG